MFNDKVKITISSGKGGDGAIAFRHEKYIEYGGPSGGNGGKGGSIYFVARRGINSLSAYRHSITIKAEPGEKGKAKLMYGRNAKDVYCDVPCGTVVTTLDGKILADLSNEGDTYLAAKGGRGGRGNVCFKSPTNRAPRVAENGLPGETKDIYLELKLLADVGLVGLPSVGKSTLLSVISNAKPEIAAYEFTTKSPNLGVVQLSDDETFCVADLPGLIEGAHLGKGLGLTFLRHIERCRVIIHVLDISRDEEDPFDSFNKINNELGSYKLDLLKRPMLVAVNKMDCEDSEERLAKLKEKLGDKYEVFPICAMKREGVKPLLRRAYELLQTTPIFPIFHKEDSAEFTVSPDKKEKELFTIMKDADGSYVITGDRVIRTYRLINTTTEEGMMKLIAYLNRIGVDDMLRKMGVKDGTIIKLDDFEFEYFN